MLSYDFNQLENITDKWGFFRQIYMENISGILQTSENDIRKWDQAYLIDWLRHFSPIEKSAWNSIRGIGGIVLYPQFPVFNFFIDFANPYLKIGLELDGKDYHDPVKDLEKDKKLGRLGWKIFRVTGKEANADYLTNNELDERGITGLQKKEAIEHWILNTCDGLLTAVKYWYFSTQEEKEKNFCFYLNPEEDSEDYYSEENDEELEKIDFHSLAKYTLEKHNLVKFII
ncbi:hypothetical protein Q766_07670 [Flavobacterium subsaxonicum WB 4.1-42 = DSM 21790]|uniref:DUF559 domain-containing protein n=2 Tax=Flavobacterium TaxID=237 RepID=A0A0A2MNS4_9FLAO|nr:hypothetical protein Q766_07670 [Flavobacterium subsaxonicum WB 4.1-42 = DSM 21790]